MTLKGVLSSDEVRAIEELLSGGIPTLRTEKIGVSANVSSDQDVASGSEVRMNVDDTAAPYFDDFGELDASENEVVLEHGSHHLVVANAYVATATTAGQLWLRVYVNGTQRAKDHIDVKNGEMGVLMTSVYLKLDAGDVVYTTVEHDTGSTETFPGGTDGNYLSVIRQ